MTKQDNIIFDVNYFNNCFGEDKSFAKELINIFLEDFRKRMNDLENGIEKNDFTKISRASHSIKGLLINIGAANISEHIKAIEDYSMSKDIKSIKQEIKTYKKLTEKLNSFLNEYAKNL